MVKYGKYYRGIHLAEFKDNYIDYKKLKQKIKIIKNSLPQFSNNSINISLTSTSSIKFRASVSSISDESIHENDKDNDNFLIFLNEFKKLLNEEFERFFNFFKLMQKQLYRKLNRHLYTQTSYISYNLNEFLEEVTNIRKTMYLAKCLNEFINDNMTAIKKILKKFDKKFHIFYGNIGPKYILDKLTIENSEMEYLLQFKVIDETSTICESNLKLLNNYFKEYCLNNKVSIEQKNEFERKRDSIYKYIKDIDEIIYFRIQYKEWFYFNKKNVQIISESKLFKNLMFNPILFSAYHKDDLMNKFLSRKDEIKEVEKMQISMTSLNKRNITLILIHQFFYNTLISGIYPLLFELVGEAGSDYMPYSLLIIASTYFFSYFSIILHKCFGIKRIKAAYLVSYIFFILGSSAYIFSYQKDKKDNSENTIFRTTMLGCLIFSRIIIGLGANPTIGKNYILNYSSKYFLPFISKIYVLISILGHSFGPLIGFFLYHIPDKKLLNHLYYSKFNCIGWYGFIMSLILFIINIILFTSPNSEEFSRLNLRKSQILYLNSNPKGQNESPFLDNDTEDSQDKEFYKLQKEKIIESNEDNLSVENNSNIEIKEKDKNKENENVQRIMSVDNEKNIDIEDKDEIIDIYKFNNSQIEGIEKYNTVSKNKNNSEIKIRKEKKEKIEPNPLFISLENLEENNIETEKEEEGSFSNVNMIPRTIDEILRKEKTSFSYLNRNLLMILFTLFFNSLLKENYIGYCSYYIYRLISEDKEKKLISAQYLSLFISVSYFLEIFSMLFILPLYRLNKLIKKLFIVLMCLSLLLMIPISMLKLTNIYSNIYYIYAYFAIISLIFLISSIIEVLSSCYLAYLTPPEWKFAHLNAGMLPLIIMTFGKLSGCLICLVAFFEYLLLNYHIILGLTFVGYGISSIFILKSKIFRIKAIARIMRKAELEQNYI